MKGELMVQQEIADDAKQHKSDENEKLREAARHAKAEVKRIESARKREVEERLAEKSGRRELEGKFEDQRSLNETLHVELQKSKERERCFRDTASEQTSRLCDINQSNSMTIKDLERRIEGINHAKANLNERCATRLGRLHRTLLTTRVASRFRLRLKVLVDANRSKHQPMPTTSSPTTLTASSTESTTSTTSETPTITTADLEDVMHFPADAIASANASISMLKRFVERAHEISSNKQQQQQQLPTNDQQQQQQQQQQHHYFNAGNHTYKEFHPHHQMMQQQQQQPHYARPSSPHTAGQPWYPHHHHHQPQQWNPPRGSFY